MTNVDINSGTVDAITSLTIANNVDVGNYTIRALGFLADGLASGRVVYTGTNGVLQEESTFAYAPLTNTLTVAKIGAFTASGAIDFNSQNMTNVDINSGTINGITALGIVESGGGSEMYIGITQNLTADRLLTINMNDAARTLNLAGNLVLNNNFTTSGNYALTITTTATTGVTFPTTGTLVTLAGSEVLYNKTLEAPYIVSFTNATHTHLSGLTGGNITLEAISEISATGTAGDVAFYNTATTIDNSAKLNFNASGEVNLGASTVFVVGTNAIRFLETSSPNTAAIDIKAPPDVTSSGWTFVLPTDNGDEGNVLRTDGTGNTSWVATGQGDITAVTITAGTGLDGTVATTIGAHTQTIDLDMSTLTDMTADVHRTQDELIILDSGADRRKTISEIPLTAFNTATFVTENAAQRLTNKTLTTPQIDDASGGSDNVYTIYGSELTSGNISITLPALAANDIFVFAAATQTLSGKTLTTPTIGATGWTNAQHNHTEAIRGGTLSASAIGSGYLAIARGGTGASSFTNLITMGTHTTGNYVATITGGTGIDSTGGTSGESVAHSLSIDSTVATLTGAQRLTNKTFTTPQIDDDDVTDQYIIYGGALTRDVSIRFPTMGVSGQVDPTLTDTTFVLTGTTQTLINKTLTAPTITLPAIAVTQWTNAQHNHAEAVRGGTISASAIGSGTLAIARGGTGATSFTNLITMGSHTTGNYVATITGGGGISSTGGTSGESTTHTLSVDSTVVLLTGAQVLYSKTLEAPTIVSFANATHTHLTNITGGNITLEAISEISATGTAGDVAFYNTATTIDNSAKINLNASGEVTLGASTVFVVGTNLIRFIETSSPTTDGIDMKAPPEVTSGGWTFVLPTDAGLDGQFLQIDGTGNTAWASESTASGTVSTGTANSIAYYAAYGTTVSSSAMFTDSDGDFGIGVTALTTDRPPTWRAGNASTFLEIRATTDAYDAGIYLGNTAQTGTTAKGLWMWTDGSSGHSYIDTASNSTATGLYFRDRAAGSGTTKNTMYLNDGSVFLFNSLFLMESGGGNDFIRIQAPSSISNNGFTLTLPTTLGGLNNVLKTDASGNLSWLADVVTDGGTANNLTALSIANNVDVGNYTIRALGFIADGIIAGRVVYAGTNGLLSSEGVFLYNATSNTLTVPNIAAFSLTGKLTAGSTEIEGSSFDINGGTVDAITSLTIANNVDVGNYTIRANNFLADGLASGRVVYTGTSGVLTEDSAFTYASTSNTLTVAKRGQILI